MSCRRFAVWKGRDMPADSDTAVKSEIAFFMEKSFQVSFGYAGAVAALTAGVAVENFRAVVEQTGLRICVVWALSLLVLDFIYLTTAGGCLFGVLKRGYFILS